MYTFLPIVSAPNANTASIVIPNYNPEYEQRSQYPYIYTSTVLMDERVNHERSYTKDSSVQSKPILKKQPEEDSTEATLIRKMVNALDPLTAMYSPEWLKDIELEFRDAIRSFLADEANSSVLGKTRCRDCLYYFEKPLVIPSKTRVKSIGTFLSFWWGAPVSINGVSYPWKKTAAPGQPIFLVHLDNGQWKYEK
jgi:hypothetical protein